MCAVHPKNVNAVRRTFSVPGIHSDFETILYGHTRVEQLHRDLGTHHLHEGFPNCRTVRV